MYRSYLEKMARFEADKGKGSEAEEDESQEEDVTGDGKDKKIEMTQAELNRIDAETKRKAKAAARKELLEELGVEKVEDAKSVIKSAKDSEEANKSELEKANSKLTEANTNLQKLQAENTLLKRRISFRDKVSELDLSFVNTEATEDAFNALDLDVLGEDLSGMEKAIKNLQEKRGYYFGDKQEKKPKPPEDGRQKGTFKPGAASAEQQQKVRARIGSL